MRILLIPDPARPERTDITERLARGLIRLGQDVRLLDPGEDADGPAGLVAASLLHRRVTVDAFAAPVPAVAGLRALLALARKVGLPRLRLDVRGFDFVIHDAGLPLTVLPRRGQRTVVLAGEVAPLPWRPAGSWARRLTVHDELVFPSRAQWHRALAEAPHIAACPTRIAHPDGTGAGLDDDPLVHFARRVIGFTVSPSRPVPVSAFRPDMPPAMPIPVLRAAAPR